MKINDWESFKPKDGTQASYRRIGNEVEMFFVTDDSFFDVLMEVDAGLDIDYSKIAPGAKLVSETYTWEITQRMQPSFWRRLMGDKPWTETFKVYTIGGRPPYDPSYVKVRFLKKAGSVRFPGVPRQKEEG
jgi:hypothetical protein